MTERFIGDGEVSDAIRMLQRQLAMLGSDELLRRTYPEEKEAYQGALEAALEALVPAQTRYQELQSTYRAQRQQRREELLAEGYTSEEVFDILWGKL